MDSLTLAAEDAGPSAMGASLGSSMPAFAPLAMPAQSFKRFSPQRSPPLAAPALAHAPFLTRLFVFGGALALTAYGAHQMYRVVEVGASPCSNGRWWCCSSPISPGSRSPSRRAIVGFVWLLVRAPAARPADGACASERRS